MKNALIKIAAASAVGAAFFAATPAFAACATTKGKVSSAATSSTNTYTLAEGTADDTCYMQNGFSYNVSSNVGLAWEQSEAALVVQTASTKGRNNFAGSSEGGSVAVCGKPTTGTTAPTPREPTLAAVNGCTAE
ncbi:MAG: hypothetical protein Q4G39_01040 [Brachymonas sp.]|nr:hypothetical protein [Brachymonas sp.]